MQNKIVIGLMTASLAINVATYQMLWPAIDHLIGYGILFFCVVVCFVGSIIFFRSHKSQSLNGDGKMAKKPLVTILAEDGGKVERIKVSGSRVYADQADDVQIFDATARRGGVVSDLEANDTSIVYSAPDPSQPKGKLRLSDSAAVPLPIIKPKTRDKN